MQLGPFDGRKKRSRCARCSASHLKVRFRFHVRVFPVAEIGNNAANPQSTAPHRASANPIISGQCSGEQPCSNCAKKSLACKYGPAAASKPVIFVEGGSRHRTVDSPASQSIVHRSSRAAPVPLAGPGVEDECYMYYFEIFSQRNNFTGKRKHFADDVKQLSGSHAAPFFLDSLRALGALQAAKLLPLDVNSRKQHAYSSVVFYAKAVESLRESLEMDEEKMSSAKRTTLLWTTLLLGIYEVRVGTLP